MSSGRALDGGQDPGPAPGACRKAIGQDEVPRTASRGLITFQWTAASELTRGWVNRDARARPIDDRASLSGIAARGSTNLYAGLRACTQEPRPTTGSPALVLITDAVTNTA